MWCWFFGHRFCIDHVAEQYILRWCIRCGKVHNLDMIRSSLTKQVMRLEWSPVEEVKPK